MSNTDVAVGQVNNKIDVKTANLPLYIVMTEAFRKVNAYVCSRQNREQMVISFKGYQVDAKEISQLSTWNDAEEFAEGKGLLLTELTIPWNRVISIENVSYRQRKA